MDPRFRTVALIAASLGLIVSLFFVLRSSDDEGATPATVATAEPTPPPSTGTSAETTPTPTPVFRIRLVVLSSKIGHVRRFTVDKGQKVQLDVTTKLTDEIHVHGYDLKADVAPGKPAKIKFTAKAPGVFEIELEKRGVTIAELEVRP